MSAWRPIDTYHPGTDPKHVLLSGRYANCVAWVDVGYWMRYSSRFAGRQLDPPTHWQPLPDPPEAAGDQR